MKRFIVLITLTVIMVCIATACSAGNESIEVSTTAVTDADGQTQYYEYVTGENGEAATDDNGNALFAVIETDSGGSAVTERSGEYVTKSRTVTLNQNAQGTTEKSNTQGSADNANGSDADNEVEFIPGSGSTTTTTQRTTTTTAPQTTDDPSSSTTQSATDSEGWINKWY